MPVAVAALFSGALAILAAHYLRVPWWAKVLAAVVSWFALGLQLAIWEVPEGQLHSAAGRLAILPTIAGGLYALLTRGVIGPPEGPLPRSY